MIEVDALSALSALAHPTRLATFRSLVAHEPEGLTTGQLVEGAGLTQSTFSTHLAVLAKAKLVTSEKRGRTFVQRADIATLRALMLFLARDCCQGRAELCEPLLADLARCRPETRVTDIVIYHNPDCGTSRNTLALIRNTGIKPHVVEYLTMPPARALLVELWIALVVNRAMFVAEMADGVADGSKALQADALDVLGDAANYAISLTVAGMARAVEGWDARGVRHKRARRDVVGGPARPRPQAGVMGIVGRVALLANVGVAVMLDRYRGGDANRRAVWICSRNGATGNVAVVFAAAGVFGTGTAWHDLLVAAGMAVLGIRGGSWTIAMARAELAPHGPSDAGVARC